MIDEVKNIQHEPITYVISGNPIAWARAHPHGTKMWDAQKKLKFVQGIQLAQQHKDRPLYEGPLHLEAYFFFAMPPSHHKRFDQLRGSPHYFKPDLSNLLKLIEDVATGILYKDDSLISSIAAYKQYADTPRTEFIIREIQHGR